MNSPNLRFKEGEKSFPDWEAKSLKQLVTRFIVPMRDKPKNLNGSVPWCRIEDFNGRYLITSKSGQGVSLAQGITRGKYAEQLASDNSKFRTETFTNGQSAIQAQQKQIDHLNEQIVKLGGEPIPVESSWWSGFKRSVTTRNPSLH